MRSLLMRLRDMANALANEAADEIERLLQHHENIISAASTFTKDNPSAFLRGGMDAMVAEANKALKAEVEGFTEANKRQARKLFDSEAERDRLRGVLDDIHNVEDAEWVNNRISEARNHK